MCGDLRLCPETGAGLKLGERGEQQGNTEIPVDADKEQAVEKDRRRGGGVSRSERGGSLTLTRLDSGSEHHVRKCLLEGPDERDITRAKLTYPDVS